MHEFIKLEPLSQLQQARRGLDQVSLAEHLPACTFSKDDVNRSPAQFAETNDLAGSTFLVEILPVFLPRVQLNVSPDSSSYMLKPPPSLVYLSFFLKSRVSTKFFSNLRTSPRRSRLKLYHARSFPPVSIARRVYKPLLLKLLPKRDRLPIRFEQSRAERTKVSRGRDRCIDRFRLAHPTLFEFLSRFMAGFPSKTGTRLQVCREPAAVLKLAREIRQIPHPRFDIRCADNRTAFLFILLPFSFSSFSHRSSVIDCAANDLFLSEFLIRGDERKKVMSTKVYTNYIVLNGRVDASRSDNEEER